MRSEPQTQTQPRSPLDPGAPGPSGGGTNTPLAVADHEYGEAQSEDTPQTAVSKTAAPSPQSQVLDSVPPSDTHITDDPSLNAKSNSSIFADYIMSLARQGEDNVDGMSVMYDGDIPVLAGVSPPASPFNIASHPASASQSGAGDDLPPLIPANTMVETRPELETQNIVDAEPGNIPSLRRVHAHQDLSLGNIDNGENTVTSHDHDGVASVISLASALEELRRVRDEITRTRQGSPTNPGALVTPTVANEPATNNHTPEGTSLQPLDSPKRLPSPSPKTMDTPTTVKEGKRRKTNNAPGHEPASAPSTAVAHPDTEQGSTSSATKQTSKLSIDPPKRKKVTFAEPFTMPITNATPEEEEPEQILFLTGFSIDPHEPGHARYSSGASTGYSFREKRVRIPKAAAKRKQARNKADKEMYDQMIWNACVYSYAEDDAYGAFGGSGIGENSSRSSGGQRDGEPVGGAGLEDNGKRDALFAELRGIAEATRRETREIRVGDGVAEIDSLDGESEDSVRKSI